MDYILLGSSSNWLKFLDCIVSLFEENYTHCYMKYRKDKYERSKLPRENIFDENCLPRLEKVIAVNAVNILCNDYLF
ncbi:MAG: hypothetical protein ACR5K2_05340 [Wolbachia sp.]